MSYSGPTPGEAAHHMKSTGGGGMGCGGFLLVALLVFLGGPFLAGQNQRANIPDTPPPPSAVWLAAVAANGPEQTGDVLGEEYDAERDMRLAECDQLDELEAAAASLAADNYGTPTGLWYERYQVMADKWKLEEKCRPVMVVDYKRRMEDPFQAQFFDPASDLMLGSCELIRDLSDEATRLAVSTPPATPDGVFYQRFQAIVRDVQVRKGCPS